MVKCICYILFNNDSFSLTHLSALLFCPLFMSLFLLFSLEHWNYFGTDEKLGPVALSIRREKLDDTKDLKDQYQYRVIFRTSEVCIRAACVHLQ